MKENCEQRGLGSWTPSARSSRRCTRRRRRYADSGHLVALVGHADHVEVIGTRGERPDQTVVIESPEDAAKLDSGGKPIAVVTQTTLSLDDVAATVDALGERFGDLRRPAADDICYATQNRQDAVKELGAGRRDADPRDRLGDELERAASRRGGANATARRPSSSTARAGSTRTCSSATRPSA